MKTDNHDKHHHSLRDRVKPPGSLKINSNFVPANGEEKCSLTDSHHNSFQKRFSTFKSPVNLATSRNQLKKIARTMTEIHSPSVYNRVSSYNKSEDPSMSSLGSSKLSQSRPRSKSKSVTSLAKERVQAVVSQKLKPTIQQQYNLRWTVKKNEIKRVFRFAALSSILSCCIKLIFNWGELQWYSRSLLLAQLSISSIVSVMMCMKEFQREVRYVIRGYVILQALINAATLIVSSVFGETMFFMLAVIQMILDPMFANFFGTERPIVVLSQVLPAFCLIFLTGPDKMHNAWFILEIFFVILCNVLIIAAFVTNEAHFLFKFAQQATQRKKQYNKVAQEVFSKQRQVQEEREITSYISHEVRNPLFNISNAIECFETNLQDLESELFVGGKGWQASQSHSFNFSTASFHSTLFSQNPSSSPTPKNTLMFGSFQSVTASGIDPNYSQSRQESENDKMSPLDTLRSIKEIFSKQESNFRKMVVRRLSNPNVDVQTKPIRKLSAYTEEGDNVSELHILTGRKPDIENPLVSNTSNNMLISPIGTPKMRTSCTPSPDGKQPECVTPECATPVERLPNQKFLKDIYSQQRPSWSPPNAERVSSKLKEMADFCGDVKVGVRHCLNLLNNVLDITKLDQGKLQWQVHPQPVIEVCEKALSLTKYLVPKDVEMRLDCPEQLVCYLDEKLLLQIMVNLLSNSFKFVEEGFVLLRVKEMERIREDKKPAAENTLSPTVNISFEVCDTGPGIPLEKQSKLFQKFVQVGEKSSFGSGLGLMVSQKMVNLKGGSIEVESPWKDTTDGTEHGGCKFHFTIPLDKEVFLHNSAWNKTRSFSMPLTDDSPPKTMLSTHRSEAESWELTKAEVERLQGLTVFIVDDSKLNQKQLARKLTKQPPFDIFNWQCTLCSSGSEAFDTLVMQGKHFDVIIVDTHLDPQDEISDGLQLIQKIRQFEIEHLMSSSVKNKSIIISYSGDVSAEQHKKAFASGADITWTKPLPEPTIMLRSIIEKFIFISSSCKHNGEHKRFTFSNLNLTAHSFDFTDAVVKDPSAATMSRLQQEYHNMLKSNTGGSSTM